LGNTAQYARRFFAAQVADKDQGDLLLIPVNYDEKPKILRLE
jgi:hypothetical protein